MQKKIFLLIGFISLALASLGIFLPLLPTTPFLLLSAYCFSKSSKKFHKKLLENRVFGKYIRDYQEKRGVSLKNKIIAILTIITTICFSFAKISTPYLKIFLILVLVGVSLYILKLKTLE